MQPYDNMIIKVWEERINKYGIHENLFYPEKDFNGMTNEELRSYATILLDVEKSSGNPVRKGFENCRNLEPKDITLIGSEIGEEFTKRVGRNFMEIYHYLSSRTWGGKGKGLPWRCLAYNGSLGVHEPVLKRTANVIKYCKSQGMSIQQCMELFRVAWEDHDILGSTATKRETELENKFIDELLVVGNNLESVEGKSTLLNLFG